MTRNAVVIGAGAAGLVSARELTKNGFDVMVLEQGDAVGGIWDYTPEIDDEQSGSRVYSSIYASLRTNLPRDLMAYSDYTFDAIGGGADNLPRYPHHSAVFNYLKNFARDFDLIRHIQFGTRVTSVQPNNGSGWTVNAIHGQNNPVTPISANVVLVCNGHYSLPRIPVLPGTNCFNGKITHSHNYRTPGRFAGKRVALWGASASGADISMEIAKVAAEVYWCGDRFNDQPHRKQTPTGALLCAAPTGFNEVGQLVLASGATLDIDEFMYCTGYQFDYPFLADDLVSVEDNRVHPLYRDILVPGIERLAFIGIPFLIVPFPLFEMQAKWYCAVLDGRVKLPSTEEMLEASRSRRNELVASGAPLRHYHKLGDAQADYYNRLAAECGEPPLPDWFNQLAMEAQQSRLADPAGFRDRPLSTRGPTRV